MPELPEVETVVRELRPGLQGETFVAHRVFDDRLAHLRGLSFEGARVDEVFRIAKYIVLRLRTTSKTEQFLAIHLRMSGRLFWLPRAKRNKEATADFLHARIPFVHEVTLKPQHIRFNLRGKKGDLIFVDPRRFGTVEVLDDILPLANGGLDPVSSEFSLAGLKSLLQGSKQPLKSWLLRQDRLVGIGNIYASEILYRAQILPERAAGSLSNIETVKLFRATREILELAIQNCGTTISDFQVPSGNKGSFQNFLAVYEREAEPCKRCRSEIQRIVQAGRSTYYCSKCQS